MRANGAIEFSSGRLAPPAMNPERPRDARSETLPRGILYQGPIRGQVKASDQAQEPEASGDESRGGFALKTAPNAALAT